MKVFPSKEVSSSQSESNLRVGSTLGDRRVPGKTSMVINQQY